ncbi:MAG: hypothetical protein DLM52_02355, partial [Chthoniobacterales bacterium]
YWYHCRQFAVAKRGKSTGDGRNDKRERDGWSRRWTAEDEIGVLHQSDDEVDDGGFDYRLAYMRGLAGGGGAGEREDSSADDGPDSEAGKIERGERALQSSLRRVRFAHQEFWTFRPKK